MLLTEVLKDWTDVIDFKLLRSVLSNVPRENTTPIIRDYFKAFEECKYKDLNIVILCQDPYPQKDIATGIAFANKDYVISPSLKVIEETLLEHNYYKGPAYLDPTLISWCKQGILLLNSALTVEINKPNSHTMLWRPFIADVLKRLSVYKTGIVYILFGDNAKTFKPYINKRNNYILEEKHPAYYARIEGLMPYTVFEESSRIIKENSNISIKWLDE